MPAKPRLIAFDGVRGMAALVVALWHLLTLLEVWLIYYLHTSSQVNALLRNISVFNFRKGGDEPIEIFFILSGFALTVPVMYASSKFSWRAYYPSRLMRLYLPAFASIAFSSLLVLLLPRTNVMLQQFGDLLHLSWHTFSWDAVFANANLFKEPPFAVNIPLWTLGAEVLFSVLLPVYLWLGKRVKSMSTAIGLGLIAVGLSEVGRLAELPYLIYLPLFMLGVLIAYNRESIAVFATSLYARGRWVPKVAVAATLIVILWWHLIPQAPRWLLLVGEGIYPLGAIAILIIAYTLPSWRNFFEGRVMQWFGRVSFSFYLVHVPVMVTLVFLFGPNLIWLAVLLGLPVSLLVAEAFFRIAEAPLHNLSRATRSYILRLEADQAKSTS